jgi:hypothetical protein
MVRYHWKDAYDTLSARAGNVDSEQVELAQALDLRLGSRLPAAVGAVLIRERIARPLHEPARADPSHGQLEYLSDLVEWLGIKRRLSPVQTRQQVSAWIEVLELRRAAQALATKRPALGDVVSNLHHPDEVGTVVSISDDDGRINIAGPGGKGLRPHDIGIEARASDTSAKAAGARRLAENRAASRARTNEMPSQAKIAHLRPYRVVETLGRHDETGLESTIHAAEDEKPVQAYLQERLQILAALAGPTSLGVYVRSQPSLGGQLRPDFGIAVADSAGLHWTLIELESPAADAGLKNGQLSAKARTGVQQIESWREWLADNLAMARSSGQHGLGLTDIRPESPGIVLIGRRAAAKPVLPEVQRRLAEQRAITLHSYDWLLDGLRAASQPGGVLRSAGPLEFL